MTSALERDRVLVLGREPEAVAATREWLMQGEPWSELSEDSQADLLVMASELVSNVLLHTTSVPGISFGRRGEWVRFAVMDGDDRRPRVLPVDPHRVGGNGLRVVDAWSDRWGVDAEPGGGKTVWILVHVG